MTIVYCNVKGGSQFAFEAIGGCVLKDLKKKKSKVDCLGCPLLTQTFSNVKFLTLFLLEKIYAWRGFPFI